jgi:hypothetical protein
VEVAKVILASVSSEDPQLRYTVGDDAATIVQAKRTMSDREFGNLMRKQFSISVITSIRTLLGSKIRTLSVSLCYESIVNYGTF